MATPQSGVVVAPDNSGRLLRLLSASSVMMQLLGKSTNIRMSQILEHHDDSDFSARRTKIVCTMGPSCWDVDKMVQLIDAGMNVCRLNFSHGDHEAHGKVVANLREALKQRPGKRVALLLDTKGPEIRTGVLEVSLRQRLCFVAVRAEVKSEGLLQFRPGGVVAIDCSRETSPLS